MKTLFIINGRVIDPAKKMDRIMNIAVSNGRIASFTQVKKPQAESELIDAKGLIVAPGFIDMHCHLREPGEEYKEDIESGGKAAAAGGFSTICCMANTNPVNDCAAVTEFIMGRARVVSPVNVLPIGAVSRGLKGEAMADLGDLAGAGVKAISDDGRPVMNSKLMRAVLEYASSFGLLVISHAEDLNLKGGGVMHEGNASALLGLRGIPGEAEDVMIARDIMLCSLTGSRLHIAHLSTAKAVEMIRQAKKQKIPLTCEVTPHHLTLTESAVVGFDPNTKSSPPFRSEMDKNALVKGLSDGTIDVIATDHAPHDITAKENGFEEAAAGLVGFETALPLCLKLVHDRKISMMRMIEALTSKPARIMNLSKKGSLAVGSDADIVIFNPDEPVVIRASSFKSKSRNTPFDGRRMQGKVKLTIVGGKICYKDV